MNIRAVAVKPRVVLAAGDNFYWGGITEKCGKPMATAVRDFTHFAGNPTAQFSYVFETMYNGPGLAEVPWLNVLGNHDYGGFLFNDGWDQQVAYTWGPSRRWVLPALYWHQYIDFPKLDTSLDIYFVDTNNNDAAPPESDPDHNICSALHNKNSACGPFGPGNIDECLPWFVNLWKAQLRWMTEKICDSTADWQIIVTHFPPENWGHYPRHIGDWRWLGNKCGIDLIVASHRHDQELYDAKHWSVRKRSQIPYVVAGGGGGITSEGLPGDNNQYGFFDMTIRKDALFLESINIYGRVVGSMAVFPKLNERQRLMSNVSLVSENPMSGGIEDALEFSEEEGKDLPPGLENYPILSDRRDTFSLGHDQPDRDVGEF